VAAVAGRGSNIHQLPSRQRSRLWSALSYGDVDSLQNALDAFRVSCCDTLVGQMFIGVCRQQTGALWAAYRMLAECLQNALDAFMVSGGQLAGH
jgi:hypothetical protein